MSYGDNHYWLLLVNLSYKLFYVYFNESTVKNAYNYFYGKEC